VVARFGPAGIPKDYKGKSPEVVNYLRSEGLNAYEYEAVRGVKIRDDNAKKLGMLAKLTDVKITIHAPYFINLGSQDEIILQKSINRIYETMRVAEIMGAEIIVVHPGYYGGSREMALKIVEGALEELRKKKRGGEKLGLETMGRISQIGSLEEIINFHLNFPDFVVPIIDWGHLEARSLGHVRTQQQIDNITSALVSNLSGDIAQNIHCHFSKMEFSRTGEVRHHDLSDKGYYPQFELVARSMLEHGIVKPTFIAETSALDKDAIFMRDEFYRIKQNMGIARILLRQVALRLNQSKPQWVPYSLQYLCIE